MTFFSNLQHGLIKDDSENMYPCCLYGHIHGETDFADPSNTVFGVVMEGELHLNRSGHSSIPMNHGMYFSCPGQFQLKGEGRAALFERKGFRGLFHVGGPVERDGRLVYIDNCRATVLVSPPRLGDPCLNLLTFPPEINQTKHVHPTIRMGVVLSGHGVCQYGASDRASIETGRVFYLAEAVPHCFQSGKDPMTVIAFHPDSDVGPTDDCHPMKSRTFTKY